MDIKGKIVAITGGASGIGLALAKACLEAGAKKVIALDLIKDRLDEALEGLGPDCVGIQMDVGSHDAVSAMAERVAADYGEIDLYFSNAGIIQTDAPDWKVTSQTYDQWDAMWRVNVLSHVIACKVLLPSMLKREGCGFIVTASAAGLLSQIGDTSYSVTKHAAVGFAESLAITHGDDGLYVAALCPQAVESRMTIGAEGSSATLDGIMPAEKLASLTLAAIEQGQFMIRPHQDVVQYFQNKANDYDRWIGGMRKLRRMVMDNRGQPI